VLRTVFVALAVVTLAATPAFADRPIARSSGMQAIHTHPRPSSPIVDRLDDQERVYLSRCTKKTLWCRIVQLDGGPDGWVMGADLVGSRAKLLATPYEFSFDPMHPLGGLPGHEDHWPFD
jgi:hypothetical protein